MVTNDISPTRRRRLVIGAARFMASGGYLPTPYERHVLAMFAFGRITIEEAVKRLESNQKTRRK